MEVTYELTPDDYWHYNLYYRRQKAPIRPILFYAFIGLTGLVFVGGLLIVIDSWLKYHQTQWAMLYSLAAMLFFSRRFLPATKTRAIKIASRRQGFFCEHTVGISPEWFCEKTSVNESKVAWTAISSIEEDHECLYFFVAKTVAHIVPKRSFTSFSEAHTFLNEAQEYWIAAKTGKPQGSGEDVTWPPPPRVLR